MANSKYEVLELRFIIEPELLKVYVLCGPGMLGVQGWHHKVFSKSRDVLSILEKEIANLDYLLWGMESPELS